MTNDSANVTARVDRRTFLQGAAGVAGLAATLGTSAAAQSTSTGSKGADQATRVDLSPIHAATEAPETTPGPFAPPDRRVGFAIVGLGRLSLNQILPAFGASKTCRVTALVSGDRAKAQKIAAQYGVPDSSITDYANYEKLASMPNVDAVYIVLPNSMHREFVERSAKIRKHVLCEKPMATSPAECEAMIAACKAANVKLMIAYRQQYEPMNRTLQKAIRDGKLGKVHSILASNGQDMSDPTQWRLNRKLAGGGCLPDVGIYCVNAARFMSGEEPEEVSATIVQPKNDPRFKEVEALCSTTMRFPSGLVATLSSAYNTHRSTFLRIEGEEAMAEMDPAFSYHGSKLRFSRLMDDKDTTIEPSITEKDQFALEMDHFAECVIKNQEPHTPGEEGLQDHRVIEAIYKAAATGNSVKLAQPSKTRGPDLPPMAG